MFGRQSIAAFSLGVWERSLARPIAFLTEVRVGLGWPAAVYLEASPICETGLDRPECWRLSRLELDGAPLPFDAAAR